MAKQSRVLGEPEAFNGYDERLLEDVAVYCSLALQRGQTAYSMDRLRARLEVMKEVGQSTHTHTHTHMTTCIP